MAQPHVEPDSKGAVGRKIMAVTNPYAAKGAIHWHIKKFSALAKSLKIGEKFTSPEFSTGTKSWSLHIYPQGRRDAWKDHIGIFLHYESEEPVMEGHFKTGWDDFIVRSELSDFLSKDDTLTVECEVECLSDWKAAVLPELTPISTDEAGCVADFAQLLSMPPSESYSDFTFDIGGKIVHAHKAVLAARSPVFRSMLATNMIESRSGHVKLTDVELPVFNAMLAYLYSGHIDEEFLATKCEDVLALADKYDIKRLKERCEVLLSKEINLDTVVNILSAAETYHASSLKNMALLYAGQHFVELIHNENFKELAMRMPALMCEIQESFAQANGIKKRNPSSLDPDEPKKKQHRAPK